MKRIIATALLLIIFTIDGKAQTLLPYEIIETRDISYAGTPRLTVRALVKVDKIPAKEDLERLSKSIWENGNKHWSEFTVYLIFPGMKKDGAPYTVGEFRPNGMKRFSIQEYALYNTKWYKPKKELDSDIVESTKVKEYTIGLQTEISNNRILKIHIKTDLPDDTKLLVTVKRLYYQKSKLEAYSGEIFSRDMTIRDGEINQSVRINDDKWFADYREKQQQFKGLGVYTGIRKISDEIQVRAVFSPHRSQEMNILNILGKNGEYVKGTGLSKSLLGANMLEVKKSIKIPFKR